MNLLLKISLFRLTFIGGALLASLTSNLVAQTTDSSAATPPSGKHAKGDKPGKPHPFEKLNLTAEQKAKVHPILKGAKEQIQALRADTSLDKKQKHQQVQAIRQDTAQKLKAILTPEQFQKFQELREERREHKGNPSKGGQPSPPATT